MLLDNRPVVLCVDEDFTFMFPEISILEDRGFGVRTFDNATDALEQISTGEQNPRLLLVIDVMLTPGQDRQTFSRESTFDFTQTGLVLLRKLVEVLGEKYLQRRCIIYSRATNKTIVEAIKAASQRYRVRYISRRDIDDPIEFVAEIEGLLRDLDLRP